MMQHLTKTERFLLNEVDSCPDKVASRSALRSAARLTPAGFARVADRMINNRLVAPVGAGQLSLTVGGMSAMRACGMEVQS